MIPPAPDRIPVHLLVGFLGSGKTTLLRRILADPEFADSAVIINELGEIGLDHELVAFAADRTVVLPGGCVCCSIRQDIEETLQQLFDARDARRIPPFRRLIIETTGIAVPQPLIFTLHGNPLAASRLSSPHVIAVVDGVLGAQTLSRHKEAAAQVAAADTIVISKCDLADIGTLPAMLADCNPWATVHRANLLNDDLDAVFSTLSRNSDAGFDQLVATSAWQDGFTHEHVRTLCLSLDRPLDWTAFGIWTTMLLHCHGDKVLRLKAMLDIAGSLGPVVFHCAQHLVHPLEHLDRWPSAGRRSRLVFVCRGLDPARLERSLRLFDATAKMPDLAGDGTGYLAAGAGGTVSGRPIRRPTAPGWLKG